MNLNYEAYLLKEVFVKVWFGMTWKYKEDTRIRVDPETHWAYFGNGRYAQLQKGDYSIVI